MNDDIDIKSLSDADLDALFSTVAAEIENRRLLASHDRYMRIAAEAIANRTVANLIMDSVASVWNIEFITALKRHIKKTMPQHMCRAVFHELDIAERLHKDILAGRRTQQARDSMNLRIANLSRRIEKLFLTPISE